MDSLGVKSAHSEKLGLYTCHGLGGNQVRNLKNRSNIKVRQYLEYDSRSGRSTIFERGVAEVAPFHKQCWGQVKIELFLEEFLKREYDGISKSFFRLTSLCLIILRHFFILFCRFCMI